MLIESLSRPNQRAGCKKKTKHKPLLAVLAGLRLWSNLKVLEFAWKHPLHGSTGWSLFKCEQVLLSDSLPSAVEDPTPSPPPSVRKDQWRGE